MPTTIAPLKECVQSVSANDSGEVSWVVPKGADHFSFEYSRRLVPSLVGRRVAGDFHRPQRRGRWRQSDGGIGDRFVFRAEARHQGAGNVRGRDRRHGIPAVAAARSETAAGAEPRPDGALPAGDARALSQRQAGVRLAGRRKKTVGFVALLNRLAATYGLSTPPLVDISRAWLRSFEQPANLAGGQNFVP